MVTSGASAGLSQPSSARGEAAEGHAGYVVVILSHVQKVAHTPSPLEVERKRAFAADPVGAPRSRRTSAWSSLRSLISEVGAAAKALPRKAADVESRTFARGRRLVNACDVKTKRSLRRCLQAGLRVPDRRTWRTPTRLSPRDRRRLWYWRQGRPFDDARPVVEEVGLSPLCPSSQALRSYRCARTKAEKLIPRRAASPSAASRRVIGMRRSNDNWSPSKVTANSWFGLISVYELFVRRR